jgi:hypothetical protein
MGGRNWTRKAPSGGQYCKRFCRLFAALCTMAREGVPREQALAEAECIQKQRLNRRDLAGDRIAVAALWAYSRASVVSAATNGSAHTSGRGWPHRRPHSDRSSIEPPARSGCCKLKAWPVGRSQHFVRSGKCAAVHCIRTISAQGQCIGQTAAALKASTCPGVVVGAPGLEPGTY